MKTQELTLNQREKRARYALKKRNYALLKSRRSDWLWYQKPYTVTDDYGQVIIYNETIDNVEEIVKTIKNKRQMKTQKAITVIILVLLSLNLVAQESPKDFTKKTYPKTYATIVDRAKKDFADDYEMQSFIINKQCEAFVEFENISTTDPPNFISATDFKKIRRNAMDNWSESRYGMLNCPSLKPDPTEEELYQYLDCFYSSSKLDFEMIMYTINKQLEAYKSLQ